MLTKPDFEEKKIIIVVPKNGDVISFKNDNIVIKDINNKIKLQVTCYRLFAVYIIGGFTLTTGIVEKSKRFGFSIVLFTSYFKVYQTINYMTEGNTQLRKKQYLCDNNIKIGKQLIINKIENQRDLLKSLRDIENLDKIVRLNEQIQLLIKDDCTRNEIMGIEGNSAKIYFKEIFKKMDWHGRKPRVKNDKINLLLDIGYTVLFNYLEALLNIYGFDVYVGNLHTEFYKRKSLVCDIIEPFRVIVDYKIRKAYNLKQLDHFEYIQRYGQYSLDWKYSGEFTTMILEEIQKYKSEIFIFVQNYYRWIMKEKEIKEFPKVRLKK